MNPHTNLRLLEALSVKNVDGLQRKPDENVPDTERVGEELFRRKVPAIQVTPEELEQEILGELQAPGRQRLSSEPRHG